MTPKIISLNETETENANSFIFKMIEKFGNECKFKYIVTPCSIGSRVEIMCDKSNEVYDITDYSQW